jgi:polyhydroxyalkanoate synthesis repressor PhaR
MAEQSYLIKKYANRRLYDTVKSTYITLDELKSLITQHMPVKILEAKTKKDITRLCLIQIILEQEESGYPTFTIEILENIIRFYGNPLREQFNVFLNKSLHMFFEQQKTFQQAQTTDRLKDPIALMAKLTAMNMSVWQDFWQGVTKPKNPEK